MFQKYLIIKILANVRKHLNKTTLTTKTIKVCKLIIQNKGLMCPKNIIQAKAFIRTVLLTPQTASLAILLKHYFKIYKILCNSETMAVQYKQKNIWQYISIRLILSRHLTLLTFQKYTDLYFPIFFMQIIPVFALL